MNAAISNNANNSVAIQLMIGAEQLKEFGSPRILESLDYVLHTLPVQIVILSITDTAHSLESQIIDRCSRYGVQVYLWTMVCADRKDSLHSLPYIQDASGNNGYGFLGSWDGLGKGDETFLFSCPTSVMEDHHGVQDAVTSAKTMGASGIFLDRIRYPSPANGLEFLSACSCSKCREHFRHRTGDQWPNLSELAVSHSKNGFKGAESFLEETDNAFSFRARMITSIVAQYSKAAHNAELRVGLDLFAPSLASLVGQNYESLSSYADFIKPMLYCKAMGPAGLPLEFSSFMRALIESGTKPSAAVEFAAGISDLSVEEMNSCYNGKEFSACTAASEFARCKTMLNNTPWEKPDLFAGIELVDHETYLTRINHESRNAYLDALAEQPIAICWNILYVPKEHIDAIAKLYRRKNESSAKYRIKERAAFHEENFKELPWSISAG